MGEFSGFLHKRGGSFHSWKRRWFAIESEGITYRETEQGKVLRLIPFANLNEILSGPSCGMSFPVPDMARCFGIDTSVNTGGRIFLVYADTEALANQWKLYLWNAILRSGVEAGRQRAALGFLKFILATPSCVDDLALSGALQTLKTVSDTVPTCAHVYSSVLEFIGNSSAAVCCPCVS